VLVYCQVRHNTGLNTLLTHHRDTCWDATLKNLVLSSLCLNTSSYKRNRNILKELQLPRKPSLICNCFSSWYKYLRLCDPDKFHFYLISAWLWTTLIILYLIRNQILFLLTLRMHCQTDYDHKNKADQPIRKQCLDELPESQNLKTKRKTDQSLKKN